MSTHTTGEWEFDGENSVTVGDVAIANLEGESDFWGVGWEHPGDEERRANGRLIAAAPDLLAALERLVGAYEQSRGPEGPDIRAARAAIAIAKAKSQ